MCTYIYIYAYIYIYLAAKKISHRVRIVFVRPFFLSFFSTVFLPFFCSFFYHFVLQFVSAGAGRGLGVDSRSLPQGIVFQTFFLPWPVNERMCSWEPPGYFRRGCDEALS